MSLYNMVHGRNPGAGLVMDILKDVPDFGRFRDAYFRKDEEFGLHMIVHTRNGGGNRGDYQHVFEDCSEHPLYIQNQDCEFDSTYADILFEMPSEDYLETKIKEILAAARADDAIPEDVSDEEAYEQLFDIFVDNRTQKEKWDQVTEAIRNAPISDPVAK